MPRGRPIATVRNHRRFNPFGALDPRQPIPCLSHDRVRRYLGNRARDGRRANRSGTDHPLAWEARVTSRTTATRVPLDELNLVGVLERGDGKGVVCALCRLVGGSRRPLTARGRYDFLSAARALVGLDDARTRDLLDELVEALEGAADVVRLAGRRAKLPRRL